MSYNYSVERPFVFTEEGQVMLLKIRDFAFKAIKIAGAVRADRLLGAAGSGSGSAWSMMACIDRLVELGDLQHVKQGKYVAGQHEIYTRFED